MPNHRDDVTTVQIEKDTHKVLEKYKIYSDETFDDAINRLLRFDREGL